jgi:hypothetical protein
VADEHAGRRVKCPVCGAVGVVPTPEPDYELVEDDSDEGTYRLGPPVPTRDDPTGRRPRGHPGLH